MERREEMDWLKDSLDSLSTEIALADLVPSGDDVAESLVRVIYRDTRTHLFHAKTDRDFYLPHQSIEERRAVSSALEILTAIVLRLAAKWFSASRPTCRARSDRS